MHYPLSEIGKLFSQRNTVREFDIGILLARNFVPRACNRAAALHGSRFSSVCSALLVKMIFTRDNGLVYLLFQPDALMLPVGSSPPRFDSGLVSSHTWFLNLCGLRGGSAILNLASPVKRLAVSRPIPLCASNRRNATGEELSLLIFVVEAATLFRRRLNYALRSMVGTSLKLVRSSETGRCFASPLLYL